MGHGTRLCGIALAIILIAAPAFAADVWTIQLDKVQPTWNPESKVLTVPVKITVFLNIDGAGALEYGNTTESVTVAWGTDVNTCSTLLIPKLQSFLDRCKKERLAMKSAQFTNLIATILAGLVI